MRRWTLLIAGAALWLFLAAIPALADGGPHMAASNSGTSTLTADSCAGCHRAHTAQGYGLLAQASEEALCLSCHGATGTGATTDVEDGIQYTLGTSSVRGASELGALRNGGFVNARIDSGNMARGSYARTATEVSMLPKIGVRSTGQAVTSAHLNLGAEAQSTAWGNGPNSATPNAGGTMTLNCASCHNPHGNGQYRILQTRPGATATGGTFIVPAAEALVSDAPAPPAGDTRNYTVIQLKGTEGTNSSYVLYASQVVAGQFGNSGDYFHRRVPWNSSTGAMDAPNGKPSTFNTQITAWCSQCHTRYASAAWDLDTGDAIYKYRHSTTTNKACTTCHVSHGSNAQMPGTYSANMTYPGGTAAPVGDSRLLKVDNRGTCQACHDPTGTITAGQYVGVDDDPNTPGLQPPGVP